MRALLSLLVSLFAARAHTAELYRLDAGNTRVSVEVRLFGLPWLSAHFAQLSGVLMPEPRSSANRLDVNVQSASLVCDNPRWNARLLSAEWFDAQRFPQISYHSTRLLFDQVGGVLVDGQLTLRGLTRDLALTVSQWRCSHRSAAGDSCSFEAHARIKRSEFGLPHGFWQGGDEVDILIHGVRAEASP
jgi:polyisoprenoid-binding protein YceI